MGHIKAIHQSLHEEEVPRFRHEIISLSQLSVFKVLPDIRD